MASKWHYTCLSETSQLRVRGSPQDSTPPQRSTDSTVRLSDTKLVNPKRYAVLFTSSTCKRHIYIRLRYSHSLFRLETPRHKKLACTFWRIMVADLHIYIYLRSIHSFTFITHFSTIRVYRTHMHFLSYLSRICFKLRLFYFSPQHEPGIPAFSHCIMRLISDITRSISSGYGF